MDKRTCVRMREDAQVREALALMAAGRSDSEVGHRTGVPRTTVRDWRAGKVPRRGQGSLEPVYAREIERSRSYIYLLGLYLGDGHISPGPRAERLRFTLDSSYPGIIDECLEALRVLVPGRKAWRGKRGSSACVDVAMYYSRWSVLFPQHGPGRKHCRPIVLARWQEELLARNHELFLRGLIHSDGCRTVASDRGRRSVRYHFSNRSEDIKSLYCASLDALGVRWTRPSDRDIAVYRQASVRYLDTFVGPKY